MPVMRVLIDVREEDVAKLRALAWQDHRSIREQAGYLLHQTIQAAVEPETRESEPTAA